MPKNSSVRLHGMRRTDTDENINFDNEHKVFRGAVVCSGNAVRAKACRSRKPASCVIWRGSADGGIDKNNL